MVKVLKENNELVDEYIFNKGIHVVEVRPDINYSAFLEGRYSEIYTPAQLKKCFWFKGDKTPDGKVVTEESPALQVIKKNPDYFPKYFEYIKKQFGQNLKEDSVRDHKEYDLPPNLNQEIMSYE